MQRLTPPYRGISDVRPYIDQPGDTAPPEAMRNVRFVTPGKERTTLGRRPALVRAFPQQVGDGTRVQAIDVISSARGNDYIPGDQQTVNGIVSIYSPSTVGQFWILNNLLSPVAVYDDAYDPGTGPTDAGGWRCAWHPILPTTACVATLQAKDYGGAIGIKVITYLTFIDTSKTQANQIVWQHELEDKAPGGSVSASARDLRASRIVLTQNHVLVCAGPYVYVFRQSDGGYIQRVQIPTWGYDIRDMAWSSKAPYRLYILAWGNPTVSGSETFTITDTYKEGADFRACICYMSVNDVPESTVGTVVLANANNQPALRRSAYPGAAYGYVENHQTLRFSEWIIGSPRGILPMSMAFGTIPPFPGSAVLASPQLIIACANQGFGPSSASFPIDGSGRAYIPAIEVTQNWSEYLSGTGATDSLPANSMGYFPRVFAFADTDSIRDDWESTGWMNDRPVDAALDPIVSAFSDVVGPYTSLCAVDSVYRQSARTQFTNRVFFFGAGKLAGDAGPPETRHNVFGWDTNHAKVWSTHVGGDVFPHCCVYDAYRNVIVVAGQRNNSWPGSGGKYAALWRLDPETGAILDTFDPGTDANVYSIAVSYGSLVIATDHVPV